MEMIYRLEDKANRPIIKLDQLFPGCTALLDTGAIMHIGLLFYRKKQLIRALKRSDNERVLYGMSAIGAQHLLQRMKFCRLVVTERNLIHGIFSS